ncbi:MAG: outer membrane beta-barrel protein [Proteobacteria bacterium]|nr:outer membrane beta-barrel protein [Pseudomonadota bacterium]
MQPGPHGQQAPASTFPGSGAPRQNFFGIEGLYSRGGGGASFASRSDNIGTANVNNIEWDTGYAVYGAVGIDLRNSFRIEAEGSYNSNAAKSISGTANGIGVTTGNIEGDIAALTFMANVAYDMTNETRLTPFIFGGAGIAGIFANSISAGGAAVADDFDWVFALQGGAGVAFDVNERISLEALYKYFETTDPEFADGSGNPFTSEYATHSVLFGARYKF